MPSDKLLNITAIVLEFLSFWFVAPELLGPERLRKAEEFLEKQLRVFTHRSEANPDTTNGPGCFSPVSLVLYVTTLVAVPFKYYVAAEIDKRGITVGYEIPSLAIGPIETAPTDNVLAELLSWPIAIVVMISIYTAIALAALVILRQLEGDDRLRQLLLILGAFLFIVSTGMQLYLAI